MKKILCILYITVFIVILTSCSYRKKVEDYSKYEKVPLTASWAYNYESVEELAKNCDLAANVSITGWKDNDKYERYGVNIIIYTAKIQESLFGEQEGTIRIVMTGKIDEKNKKIYEITEDPLMNINDSFFIFARLNEDGTYTILSGPQGRFEIIDDMVYSLNVCNEQVAKSDLGSNIIVNKQPKDEFYAQIKEAIK